MKIASPAQRKKTVSEDESEAESPTTSDEDFIVSDSEMEEEVEQEDAVEDQIELLFESFVNLQEEHKILKKELQKQSCLLFEIHQELRAAMKIASPENENCLTCPEEETVSEDESEAESPTTSDEDFIVSDSEMEEEVEQEDAVEDQIELLFESFVNLQEEHKILKKELQKQSCLLFEIHQELKEKTTPAKRS